MRAAFRHFRVRFLIMAGVLLTGSLLFHAFGDRETSFVEAAFYTWSLILAETPAEFPASPLLRPLYFLVPVAGMTIIIEGIVDFTRMLRDRRGYERSWCLMMTASLRDHVVLVGLGKVGYSTYRLLHRLGEQVVVIELDERNPFLEEVRRHGHPLFIGDGRHDQLLVDANVMEARAVIAATDDDLGNLEVALDSRRLNPEVRVVLRMFDQNMADKIRGGFDLHHAMSPSAISAPNFALAAVEPSILNSYVLDGELIVIQSWTVCDDGPLCGRTVGELQTEHGIGVTRHRGADGEPSLFPPGDTVLAAGDEVLVQAPYAELAALRARA